MLTRSKVDYSNIRIDDLIVWQPEIKSKRKISKYICASTNVNTLHTVMLFDLESYEIMVKDPNTKKVFKKWIPHQIAWEIYDAKKQDMIFLDKKNYYVSEMWINPIYRQEISDKYPESFKEHFSRISKSNYPMKSGWSILNQMVDDILKYNVKTMVSYNINTDFESLKDLRRYINSKEVTVNEKTFDCKYSNPFRFPGLNYCDLMHNIGVLYIDYLIKEGLKDEKIFRNASTKQIKLTGRDNTKSIYSAEYVLQKFFNDKQPHTADEDVKLEIKMLEKMIKDYGQESIELNVMYPNKLYYTFVDRILKNHSQQVNTAYMYQKKEHIKICDLQTK